MPYPTKPKFLYEGSNMHTFLDDLTFEFININDLDIQYRRDVVYPAKRLGLIKRSKSGNLSTTSAGRRLLEKTMYSVV